MARPPSSGNVFTDLGIHEPDVELAKSDLAIRIQRLAEHRRLTADEAAALLQVAPSDLSGLFQGRLATCSLDQLLRMLTWLGDDVEITIRPRLQRTKRGALRVLQAAAVEKPEDLGPLRLARGKRLPSADAGAMTRPDAPDAPDAKANTDVRPRATRNESQLLNKHAVEEMTSLDITTIYRRMAAGTFPQPVRVGRRRVAWRTSDIMQWQQNLDVGTETLRWKTRRGSDGNPRGGGHKSRSHQ
jgi:prophage regulatory protein